VWSLLASWQRWHTHGRVLVGEATTGVISHRIVGLSALSPWLPLPHVLQRSGMYLLIGRRWCEVEKCLDVPTHGTLPPDQLTERMTRWLSVCLPCNSRWIRPSISRIHLTLSPSTLHRVVQATGAKCPSVIQIMIRKMWIGHRVRVPVFPANRRVTPVARTRNLWSHKLLIAAQRPSRRGSGRRRVRSQ
jgi:hypothetical protein